MNDVFDYSINDVTVQAYADDITVLITAQNDTVLNKTAQRFVNHLSSWAANNKLVFAAYRSRHPYQNVREYIC